MVQSIPETPLSKKRKIFCGPGIRENKFFHLSLPEKTNNQTKRKSSTSDLRQTRAQDQCTGLLNRIIIHRISVYRNIALICLMIYEIFGKEKSLLESSFASMPPLYFNKPTKWLQRKFLLKIQDGL